MVLPDVAHHIAQRGVDRRAVFVADTDRQTYLGLLRENLREAGVRLLAWCLMTNHVHLVAVPETDHSLAVLLRRVHGRYAQYFNARAIRSGHLWQNRFFACPLDREHLWRAVTYVERNPVRAAIVRRAEEYLWSSAPAHVRDMDPSGLVDMAWWREEGPGGAAWEHQLNCEEDPREVKQIQECTYSGRPFGSEGFVEEIGERYGRRWTPGRPKKTTVMRSAPGTNALLWEGEE